MLSARAGEKAGDDVRSCVIDARQNREMCIVQPAKDMKYGYFVFTSSPVNGNLTEKGSSTHQNMINELLGTK